jgi:glutathione gamma-glutamylcysteinyltransferase
MISFSSAEGRRVFAEALAAGGLDGYFPIAEQFHTQSDPSFCGLGSLVVALNALGIDPGRLWKGPWRWFAEELLDCCVPLSEVRERGLDLEELGCLARCNGADVELRHADPSDADAFREAVRAATTGGTVLVASYDRRALDQTGSGHFSPIGGYHAERDLVLVLDVARFKYPPHWVPIEQLFRAMQSIDPATGRARGWMVLRGREQGIALGFNVTCDEEGWAGLAERMDSLKGELKSAEDLASLARALLPLVSHLELRVPGTAAHRDALATARATLCALPVHRRVADAIGHDHAEATTLLLLSISDLLPSARRADIEVLSESVPEHVMLAAEVGNVRAQLGALWTHTRQKVESSRDS